MSGALKHFSTHLLPCLKATSRMHYGLYCTATTETPDARAAWVDHDRVTVARAAACLSPW